MNEHNNYSCNLCTSKFTTISVALIQVYPDYLVVPIDV